MYQDKCSIQFYLKCSIQPCLKCSIQPYLKCSTQPYLKSCAALPQVQCSPPRCLSVRSLRIHGMGTNISKTSNVSEQSLCCRGSMLGPCCGRPSSVSPHSYKPAPLTHCHRCRGVSFTGQSHASFNLRGKGLIFVALLHVTWRRILVLF